MSKAYLIDATNRVVTEIAVNGLSDLQGAVGGYIEIAYSWPNGDTLYVNEEGLFHRPAGWFSLKERPDQMFAGDGVLVGEEFGGGGSTRDPKLTLEELKQKIGYFYS